MPTHTITLRGDVQDVGLPELVADIGTTQNRRGFAFNEADGTVKIVTSGSHGAVEAFVDDIRRRSVEIPGAIESAEVETVEGEAHLPRFVTRQTDYLTLINRLRLVNPRSRQVSSTTSRHDREMRRLMRSISGSWSSVSGDDIRTYV